MSDDLSSLKDDMMAFILGHGMSRFQGYVTEDVHSVMWDPRDNPESWKDFVELAKKAGCAFLSMDEEVLQRDELDYLVQRLQHATYPSDDDIEEARWLRSYVGKTGFLQLGWPHQGIMFLYEVSTEWYERYQHLLDLVEDFGTLAIDDTDQDDERYVRWRPPQRRARRRRAPDSRSRAVAGHRAPAGRPRHHHRRTGAGIPDAFAHSPALALPDDRTARGGRAPARRHRARRDRLHLWRLRRRRHHRHRHPQDRAGALRRQGRVPRAAPHPRRLRHARRGDRAGGRCAAFGSSSASTPAFAPLPPPKLPQRCGIDLIVTDHHLPQAEGVPKALAVVNPNQPGCEYPCKSLCGAGVAFKIAQALLEATGRERLLPSFLKMVAIATIADAVPLVGENRVFAKLGLEGLRNPVNAGLRALLANCQLDGSRPLSAGDIAFRVAPRLNAAGRMDVAERVIQLFTEKDEAKAAEMAMQLNELNGDRQQEEQRILDEIFRQIDSTPEWKDAYSLVVDGENWHRGVIGICATRVVERYHRPALVFSCENGEAHGSGRSIEAFHLLDALESCPELFTRFGGHSHAVGCALPAERLPELRSRLDAYARQRLVPEDFVPVLEYDGEIALDDVNQQLLGVAGQSWSRSAPAIRRRCSWRAARSWCSRRAS